MKESRSDVERFFASCDAQEGTGPEPDWEQHLAVIARPRRRRGMTFVDTNVGGVTDIKTFDRAFPAAIRPPR